MRHLVDTQGREWQVYERTASDFSPVAGRRSLIFDTDGIVRRLWRYPTTWAAMSDEELLGLMETLNSRARTPLV
jgi:hypothetical protein